MSSDSSKRRGKTYFLDWELKVVGITMIFAFMKLLHLNYSNSFHRFLCRSVFACFHVLFFFIFKETRDNINNNHASTAAKAESNKVILRVFRTLFGRAVLIFIIHLRAQLMPPLWVACFMGILTMLESKEYFSTIMKYLV